MEKGKLHDLKHPRQQISTSSELSPCIEVADSSLQCFFSLSDIACKFYLLATNSLSNYFLKGKASTLLQKHNSCHSSPSSMPSTFSDVHSGSRQPLLLLPKEATGGIAILGCKSAHPPYPRAPSVKQTPHGQTPARL